MKKVLFVASVVKKHIMVFHLPYLEWFKRNGYETHVCARNDYKEGEECDIPFCDHYYNLPFERSPFKANNLLVYKQLKKIIESNEYDIIHCHTPIGGVLTRLAARKVFKSKTKIIYTAHGFHFFKGATLINWLVYYPIERWMARFTDVLITINKEDYVRAQTFKAKNVQYIPGVGVDIQKFRSSLVNKKMKRNELSIPEECIVLLSVGELNENKNHETIIKAVAKINDPSIYYVICGVGGKEKYLKELSALLGISEQVKLLGFRDDVFEIYLMADMFIFPSYREGLSVALMEAMASGLPVVCSNIRGNKDLIDDGIGGYLLESDDVSGFAKTIAKVIGNDELRMKLGLNNKEKMNLFNIDIVKDKMTEIYKFEKVL